MAFGYQLANGKNESIVDETSSCMYLSQEGTARSLEVKYSNSSNYTQPKFDDYTTLQTLSPSERTLRLLDCVFIADSALVGCEKTTGGNSDRFFEPATIFNYSDICFWQIGSEGLYWINQLYIPTTSVEYVLGTEQVYRRSNKYFVSYNWERSSRPNYKILSTNKPGSPLGTFGMQVFNNSNEISLDTRYPLATISHVEIVPASIFDQLLNQEIAHYDISLPDSYPNCYVHIPMMRSFRRESAYIDTRSNVHVPKIQQLDSNTLRLSNHVIYSGNSSSFPQNRFTHSYSNSTNGYPGDPSPTWRNDWYHDTPIFILSNT